MRDLTKGKKYNDFINHRIKLAFIKKDKARLHYYSEKKRYAMIMREQINNIKKLLGMVLD